MKLCTITLDPWTVFASLSQVHTEGFFMDNWGGRGYSYMGFSPSENWEGDAGLCLKDLKSSIDLCEKKNKKFPFEGGIVGLFGYDLRREFESFSGESSFKDFPDYRFGHFSEILVFDHKENSFWANDPEVWEKAIEAAEVWQETKVSLHWSTTISQDIYGKWVSKAVDYIAAGDIFQANLAHPLYGEWKEDWRSLYHKVREHNPSPYAGIYYWDDSVILSNSPELLCDLEDGHLRTKPIAGTRPRGENTDDDGVLKSELFVSEKEQAEHIMLVDLERNDMGRLSKFGSVRVTKLMDCESYRNVHHIVSTIESKVRSDVQNWEVLPALFPGGTITGAPKIRSMEIIAELETSARGFYTGSLGWFDGNNECELNILIRTLQIKKDKVYLHVGAGIVADSDPAKEYEETLVKSNGWRRALESSLPHSD